MKAQIFWFVVLIFFVSCKESTPSNPNLPNRVDTVVQVIRDTVEVPINTTKSTQGPLTDSMKIMAKAMRILEIFKNKTYGDLSTEFLISKNGVRFSPYATIESSSEIVWPAERFESIPKDPIEWGVFDGSGDPILLPFGEYADRFIFDYDFRDPDSILFNRIRQRGNLRNNIRKIYPKAQVIEFFIDGKNGAYSGYEWRVLRLIFKMEEGDWKLAGIVHSEWTT